MATDMKEGPIRGGKDDHASKGYPVIPPNDGDLWKGREVREQVGGFTFLEGEARGGKTMASGNSTGTGLNPGAPVWLEGRSVDANAINRVGGFGGETSSDPMFDKFKHEENSMSDIDANRGTGSESPEKVSSGSLPSDDSGTHSDPLEDRLPAEQQKGGGGNPNHLDIA
jgi:hypothetical protein